MIRSFRRLLVLGFLASVALAPIAAILGKPASHFSTGVVVKIGLYCVVAAAGFVGFVAVSKRLEPSLSRESLKQAEFLDSLPSTIVPAAIVLAAGLSLFLELAVIRWQASMFEFFAFYKNFGLLACFAGLGIGYAMARDREGVPLCLTIPLFAWQFAFLTFLRYGMPPGQAYSMIPFREQLTMGMDSAKSVQMAAIYLLLAVVFLLTALAFLPVGQLCGRLMEQTKQLRAYGGNLAGSLLGVVLMFVVSFLWTPRLCGSASVFSRSYISCRGVQDRCCSALASRSWHSRFSPGP